MDIKLVFVTWHYKKGWLSVDYFLFGIYRFILININRNNSQKSWELILRTYILQASCVALGKFSADGWLVFLPHIFLTPSWRVCLLFQGKGYKMGEKASYSSLGMHATFPWRNACNFLSPGEFLNVLAAQGEETLTSFNMWVDGDTCGCYKIHYYTVLKILFLLRVGHFFHNIHANRVIKTVLKSIIPRFVSSS